MSSFQFGNAGAGVPYFGKSVLYGNPNPPYELHEGEGDPPNGWAKVATPGDIVPADIADRYNLAAKFKPTEGQEPPQLRSSVNGEPLVMVGGRAIAESIAPDYMKSKPANKPGQPADRNAPAKPVQPASATVTVQPSGPHVVETPKSGEPAKAK